MYYENIMRRHIDYCSKRIRELESRLQHFPEGKIECYYNGKNYSWRIKLPGQKRKYLPKKYEDLAVKLAQKRCAEAEIADLKAEIEACSEYLKSAGKKSRLEAVLKNKGLAGLVSAYHTQEYAAAAEHASAADWQAAEYEKCPLYPERLAFAVAGGGKVRSKSEALIANLLQTLKIPYRYEQACFVGGKKYFPDFTALNLRTGQEFLIEHFGMMNNPEYSQNTASKIKHYLENGYIPYLNILFFFEGNELPLDMEMIRFVFEKYLL